MRRLLPDTSSRFYLTLWVATNGLLILSLIVAYARQQVLFLAPAGAYALVGLVLLYRLFQDPERSPRSEQARTKEVAQLALLVGVISVFFLLLAVGQAFGPAAVLVVFVACVVLFFAAYLFFRDKGRRDRFLAGAGRTSPIVAGYGAIALTLLAFFCVTIWFLKIGGLYLSVIVAATTLWGCFALIHYRNIRQEEMMNLLATSVEAGVPLAPALAAYLDDRPRGSWRTFWRVLTIIVCFPAYYWLWHRFERKVGRVVERLADGDSLHAALAANPGVAPREVLLAAAVGESTGQLAPALRNAPRWRLTPVWLEAAPRLLYPVLLLIAVSTIVSFLTIFIIPKYEKIFADLRIRLPLTTDTLIYWTRKLVKYYPQLFLLFDVAVVLLWILLVNPSISWYIPGVGRLYRMQAQGRVLTMLGVLLDAGKPLPEALGVLASSGYFGTVVRKRLERARRRVEEGESLAAALQADGLLPTHMAPLLQAAERARNLPWAAGELGELLGKRVARTVQRLALVIFPVSVLACGLLVGFVALGIFTPLITLISAVGK